jgi:hypothetical protein
MSATEPACRAVVAARLHRREAELPLLRALRVRTMAAELLDEPATLSGAAADVGLDGDDLAGWMEDPEVERALAEDKRVARRPLDAALALDHKLADAEDGRRYTCPSYELERAGEDSVAVPGFQPFESYDVALANLEPQLDRRPPPDSVEEVLRWAAEPLATAEVAALRGIPLTDAREELARVAVERPVGTDGYWTLP